MNEDVYIEFKKLVLSRIQGGQWIFGYKFTDCELKVISKRLGITDDIEEVKYTHAGVELEKTYKAISSTVVFSYLQRLVDDFQYVLFSEFSGTDKSLRGNRGVRNLSRPLKAFAGEKIMDQKCLIVLKNGIYIDRDLAFMFKLTA